MAEITVKFVETEAEMEAYLGIRKEVFVEEQNVDVAEEIDEMDELVLNRHILMLYDGVPVGAARLKALSESLIKYQRIAILKSHRGLGLGAVLLEKLDFFAKEMGFREVAIEAQKYAEPFYQKCGFLTTDPEIFLDAGIEHVRMEKSIS